MIEEIDELITDMQAICNAGDEDVVIEIANHAADRLGSLNAILPETLNKRRCHDCGRVAYHVTDRTPHVCCGKCGSQDTRFIRPRAESESAPESAPDQTIVTLPNGRQAIELADDVHQDEPVAWMVLMHDDTLYEYRVFSDFVDARRCADDQAEQSGRDWLIYPLYASHGQH